MIGQLQNKNKRGRTTVLSSGPSSYDKYRERKEREEAVEEEKRRYENEQRRLDERERQTTQLEQQKIEQRAPLIEQQAATAAEQAQNLQQQRAQAQELFKRSKKKEDRIEAYRGLLQGLASRNKALAEEGWAALTPDLPDENREQWAEVKRGIVTDPETGEPVIDPQTGKPIRRFQAGRPEDDKAMPAPNINFNDDGSITVEFPGPGGRADAITYADADELIQKGGVGMINPEFEQDAKSARGETRLAKKESRLDKTTRAKELRYKIKDLDKQMENDLISREEYKKQRKAMTDRLDKLTGIAGDIAKKSEVKSFIDKEGQEVYNGKKKPYGYPKAKRAPNGGWYIPDGNGGWIPVKPYGKRSSVAKK
jgi:hypothetical protein